MKIPSRGTPEFWRLYRALPAEVKALARKCQTLMPGTAVISRRDDFSHFAYGLKLSRRKR